MSHWAKTIRGKALAFLVTASAVAFLVWVTIGLWGPDIWAAFALTAITWVVVSMRRRRTDAERKRIWIDAGSFSFGDVLRRRQAREALQS
jgi:predicted PurR-regulated permease PerM